MSTKTAVAVKLTPVQKAAAARNAGAKGRTAQPMSTARRVAAYVMPGPKPGAQVSVSIGDETAARLGLTPRQRRRVASKARRMDRQAS